MYTFNIDPKKTVDQFQNANYIFMTLRGVFLALLIFSASFLAPYLGCNFQYVLRNEYYTRYILLFLVIYFSINIVDPELGNKEHPIYVLLKSIFVFIIFLLINEISVNSIIFVMILFALLIFTSKYYYFVKETSLPNQKHNFAKDILMIIQITLSLCIFAILIISYFIDKKKVNNHLTKCSINMYKK